MNAKLQQAVMRHEINMFQENPELCQKAVDLLNDLRPLFTRSADEPVYSIGFQRWQKLTKRQRVALHVKFDFDSNAVVAALQTQPAQELLEKA